MKKLRSAHKNNRFKTLILGITISLIVSLFAGAMLGAMFVNNILDENYSVYSTATVQFASVFLGAFIASQLYQKDYIITSAVIGVTYFLVLIAMTLLVFDTPFSQVGLGAVACTIVIILSAVLCLVSKTKRVPKKHWL